MVRPDGRRGDDDLGPITDRTGRVQGRIVTVSSIGLRRRHSTSDLPSTSTPFAVGFYYDTSAPGLLPNHHLGDFFEQIVGGVPLDSSYSTYDDTATDYGSGNKRPDKTRDISVPTQRKKGGPVDPELIPLYGDHVAGPIWHRQSDLSLAFTSGGINGQEQFDVATDPRSRLSSSDRAAYYIQYLLGSSLFTDKSGNIVPSRLWPLVKDVRSSRGFAWGVAMLAYLYRNLGQASHVDA
ncbi:hypothetical protein M9H77_03124 [Catharanthus roseus]|uniref:Uncharacterized protein n=1 Tax=Catharanthus roseus TaxID=4058 RepID=A0ACC0CAU7_CATRO|nr:hypothetical protein M9H77_03124 [Catharanthus roseus]